ncbi:SRPBCC family protein [Lysinibacillus halotolerans]|uniref:SRPBCC family protein n=1 Tax=Lysinibacillus halotolerans TaxID=1368476 RepID=UPI00131451B8|nr:SRPBCC family protein [Lysinibacillus halotolerans]
MIASLYKSENGTIAEYDRIFSSSQEEVWDVLTNNEKLKLWMHHLEITNLGKGGHIKFHFHDGSGNVEDITITDFEEGRVLAFEWGNDIVRFAIQPKNKGTQLIMKQIISEITDHTPKDLAGWHVCLLHFSDVVNKQFIHYPENEWEKWYEKYKEQVEKIMS